MSENSIFLTPGEQVIVKTSGHTPDKQKQDMKHITIKEWERITHKLIIPEWIKGYLKGSSFPCPCFCKNLTRPVPSVPRLFTKINFL